MTAEDLTKIYEIYQNQQNQINHLYEGLEKIFLRLEKIETENKEIAKGIDYVDRNYDSICLEINNRLCKIEENFSKNYKLVYSKKIPHKCPVCDGATYIRKEIPKGESDFGCIASVIKCFSCEETGIVWG